MTEVPVEDAPPDPGEVREVLWALSEANNKFTPRDEDGVITLRCYPRAGQLVIEVADQGLGIEEADLDRLFEPFTRVRREHAR